jgi:hypothetical protein
MTARKEPAHYHPALRREEVAAPQKLCVRYSPVVGQPRILGVIDRYHRHMEVTAGKLGRLSVVIAVAIWTLVLVTQPMDDAGGSFLHLINLVFHEAGHIIFSPFGRFMTILGGSLMQVLVPVVCALTLYFQNEDRFGAALCGWWAGENLLDLAPYINDARALNLILLGGPANAVEGHDWEAILTSLGWLHLDHTLARGAHLIGASIMWAALIWASGVTIRSRS